MIFFLQIWHFIWIASILSEYFIFLFLPHPLLQFIKHFTGSQACIHLTHPMLSSLQTEASSTDGTVLVRPMKSCLPSSRCPIPSVAAPAEDASIPLVEPPAPGQPAAPLMGLKRRLKRAFCQPGNATENPVLEVYRYVILPELKPGG